MPDEQNTPNVAVEESGVAPAEPQPGEVPPAPETPPAPEPEAAPVVDDRYAAMEARLAAAEERERRYLQMLEKQQPAPAPAAAPEPDEKSVVDQYFQGATAEGLSKFAEVMEAKFAKKFAPREEVQQVAATTAHMSVEAQLRETAVALQGQNIPAADITKAQKMIREEMAKAPNQKLWRSPEAAYHEMLGRIEQERKYSQAEIAKQKKVNVVQRQQKNVAPVSEAPSGSGKVELDVKKWIKDFHRTNKRRPTDDELFAEVAKAES